MEPRPHILLIDDDADLAVSMRDVLQDRGYDVTVVRDGNAAVDLCAQRSFDVALVDIRLPGPAGMELIQRLGELLPQMEQIVMTAYASLETAAEAVGLRQVVAYESKPVDIERLLALLDQIVGRKRAEDALRENEEKYRNVVERANDGIVILQDMQIKYVNPAVCRMVSREPEELIGTYMHEHIHPDYLESAVDRYKRRFVGEDVPLRYELAIVRKGGGTVMVEVSGGVISYQGQPADLVIVRDITERKQAEDALRESEAKHSAVVERVNDGVVVIQDGGYKFVNQAWTRITGFSADELMGKTIVDLVMPEEREKVYERYRARMAGGDVPPVYETRIMRKDGTVKDVELSAVIIEWEGRPADLAVLRDITQRKKSEEAFREAMRKFEAVIENTPLVAVQGFDRDGVVHYWNHVSERLYGFSAQEAVGRRIQDLVLPAEEIADFDRILSEIWARCEPSAPREWKVQTRSGETRWMFSSMFPTFSAGSVDAVYCMDVDITERKEAEVALRQSEEKYRTLVEGATEVVFRISLPEVKYEYVSPAAEKVFGYSAQDFMDNPGFIKGILHPDFDGYFEEVLGQLLRGEVADVYEFKIVDREGHSRWIRQTHRLFKDEGGNPAMIEGICVDITEGKEAEEALRAREAQLRATIDNLPFDFWAMDGELRYTAQNARCRANWGNLIGKQVEDLSVPPEIKALWTDQNRRALAGEPTSLGYEAVFKGQPRAFENSVAPVRIGGEVAGVIGLAIDVTERKRAERELRDHRERLEELVAERTAELQATNLQLAAANIRLQEADRLKSIFLASMSHEFRTPLNSIIGFTGILLKGLAGELTDEQKKQLTMVKDSGTHLLSLVNDVLDVARIEAGRVEPVFEDFDLGKVVAKVAELCRPQADRKDLSISVQAPPGMAVYSDRRRVKQVLVNLVGNAVKYTECGTVSIEVREADDRVVISVADTGPGIRSEDMHRLFEPFQQLDDSLTKSHEGTGLGLYLSRKLALMLGGEITVQSEFGKGSVFRLSIPRSGPPGK